MTLHFERFRFDRANQRLEDAGGAIPLNPKAFEVLRVLVERSGQLVLKDQLLDEVWSGTHVADGVLKVCIAEIRRALGDSATEPRFIETVHRRGYRFVATVTASTEAATRGEPTRARSGSLVVWPAGGVPTGRAPVGLVGRGGDLALLEERLASALRGERQVVFVTGEAGAGKTALVEHFVAGVARRETVAATGSQCLEQFGSAEAYMPVLEAVGRLVREDAVARSLLRRYAPTWLAQLPWLIEEADRDRLGRELLGAARERMLREMAEFVEALAAEVPLVLVLDDLHWSDPSTVDLLALLAGRRERARLLLLATYRPAELVLARHPLRAVAQRLAASRQCAEVALDDLGVDAVAEYLERRFAGSRFPSEVARLVRERSDGNPLFLVTLIEHLLARGAIVERDRHWHVAQELRGELAAVPESLRRLIEQQLELLRAKDRALLEAASLVGLEFSAAAAAAGANRDPADTEERCEQLAAGGPFLRHVGRAAWPDGTVAGSFAFRHPLYREALAAAVPGRRRADSHLRIAVRLERAHGERSSELAAELALHFEEGGERARAVRYRRLAAQTAAGRHALVEAETHLEQALSLLGGLPASPERDREELSLQSMIGPVRMATRGFGAPEVERAYTRALELSSEAPQAPSAFPALWGLAVFYGMRGELDRALELGERNRVIAEANGDRLMRLIAHHGLWAVHYFRGELTAALRHLDEGEPLYEPVEHRGAALVYGWDPKMAALSHRACVLWALGRIDQAVEVSRQAVEHARALGHPLSLAHAMYFSAWIRQCRREPETCREEAEALITHATEEGIPFLKFNGLALRGWALVEHGELERGLADLVESLGASIIGGSLGQTPHLASLAAALARAGRLAEARQRLDECKALTATGERFHEPEIHRLDAELILTESGGAGGATPGARERAEELLHAAIECASRRGARTLELRAVAALVRLCGRGAKGKQARTRLADLLARLTEGFDTADLQEARRLVAR
jgi:DNA-binding winged helix-turn-helix (wHTH) protein/tetratricopeptide (TPR) repeat protein